MYLPSFDQAAAKAAKMPSSRANTAVDLMAVGGEVRVELSSSQIANFTNNGKVQWLVRQ